MRCEGLDARALVLVLVLVMVVVEVLPLPPPMRCHGHRPYDATANVRSLVPQAQGHAYRIRQRGLMPKSQAGSWPLRRVVSAALHGAQA